MSTIRKKYFSGHVLSFEGLSTNTFLLTLTSLFADISTEMLYPVLPIFLTQNLKAPGSIVGIIEGVAVATQNIVQGLAGWLSDKLQRRKPIAIVGYSLAAVAKPLIGFSTVWQGVFAARFLDRLGSGTRSAPRDALVAASAEERHRGKAFGLEGVGDNLGAFLGPLAAVALLFYFKVEVRSIFYLAFIPGLLAVFLVFLVKEKRDGIPVKYKLDTHIQRFPLPYWHYLAVIAIFGMGNVSSSFFILQTKAIGVSLEGTILIYALYNLMAALISFPSGYLSDTLGRKTVLSASFLIFLATAAGFAVTTNILATVALFALYGLYQGIFRSVGKAFATDFVPQNMAASGVGWYNTTVGLSGLVASVIAGLLWDKIGHSAVFLYAAIFAGAGSISLLTLPYRSLRTTMRSTASSQK